MSHQLQEVVLCPVVAASLIHPETFSAVHMLCILAVPGMACCLV